jgi:hypothetical protein
MRARFRRRFGRRGGRRTAAQRRQDRDRRNRERLNHAISVLRPRIEQLIARRVWKPRLRAQLAWWRTRFRIRRLALTGSGNHIAVNAANSPGVDIVRGVLEAEGVRVYRMVREIAVDLLRQPGTRALAAQIGAQREPTFPGGPRGTSATRPVELPPHIPAQTLDILQTRPPGWLSHYVMGPGRQPLTEFRGRGMSAGSMRVQSPTIGGGAYADVLASVPNVAPVGTAPSAMGPAAASALTTFQQRGNLPPGLLFVPQAATTAAAITRLAAVEGARDPGYLVTRAVLMEAMREGALTPQQAFIGMNPMERPAIPKVRTGAPRTAAELARIRGAYPASDPLFRHRYPRPLSGAPAAALPAEMERLAYLEREAIASVIRRLQAIRPLFRDENDLRTYIRRELQDELARIARRAYPNP